MYLRTYRSSDCPQLLKLFYDTVHTVNAADYTEAQLNAWADGKADAALWDRTLSEHYTIIAEVNGIIAGFGDIDLTGYLDRLYVHKDIQHQGVASAICDKLESHSDNDIITVHASITAKPFFISRGYAVIKEQQVIRHNVSLTNFIMEKHKNH